MATVVSFINFKGGVGKTTLSVEIAASLYKKHNSRVLMLDLDPQSNCTLYWLNEQDWETQINAKKTLLAFFEACLKDEPFDLSTLVTQECVVLAPFCAYRANIRAPALWLIAISPSS